MNNSLKIMKIGNSAGVILSKDMLEKLKAEKGDTVFAVETPNGIELTAYDPIVARQMEVAKKVMKKHREVLRKLAE
jgi:putative addiction module antidote